MPPRLGTAPNAKTLPSTPTIQYPLWSAGGGGASICCVVLAALGSKFALPEYVAVIWCVPGERPVLESVATPPLGAMALPEGVPSIANWTVPAVGGGVTVAVNVTVAANGAGLRLDVSVVVVSAAAGGSTSWVMVAALGVKFVLPE